MSSGELKAVRDLRVFVDQAVETDDCGVEIVAGFAGEQTEPLSQPSTGAR